MALSKYIKPFRLLLSFDSDDFMLEDNTEDEANPWMISDAIKITDCFENDNESDESTIFSMINNEDKKFSNSFESNFQPLGDRRLLDFWE